MTVNLSPLRVGPNDLEPETNDCQLSPLRVGPNDLGPETNDSQFISPVTAVGFHGVQRKLIPVDIFFVFLRLLFFALLLIYVT